MYKIIGADKKEYGPVTAAQLHQWISEGRANPQTMVQAIGGGGWKPLSAFPEFADSLRTHIEPPAPPITPPVPELTLAEVQERDYELDIIACVGRGWTLVKENMGILVGGFVILAALSIVSHYLLNTILERVVPVATRQGPVFLLASGYISLALYALVTAPLAAGYYLVILRRIRGQPASADGVFSGFQSGYLQIALGSFMTAFLAGLSMIPFNVVFANRVGPIMAQFEGATTETMSNLLPHLMDAFSSTLPYFLVGLIPAMYFGTSLFFTLPLIADKKLSFGAAMKVGWRMVNKHWFLVFGLSILIGLLNVLGLLCCAVGLLFTIPTGLAATMFAYETIFSGGKPQSH